MDILIHSLNCIKTAENDAFASAIEQEPQLLPIERSISSAKPDKKRIIETDSYKEKEDEGRGLFSNLNPFNNRESSKPAIPEPSRLTSKFQEQAEPRSNIEDQVDNDPIEKKKRNWSIKNLFRNFRKDEPVEESSSKTQEQITESKIEDSKDTKDSQKKPIEQSKTKSERNNAYLPKWKS